MLLAVRVDREVDDLADPQIFQVGEAETAERALHRRALHVEDAGLQADEDADLHTGPTRRR